jgi:5-carboxymethyl-2-hydroxymuconate isomerase
VPHLTLEYSANIGQSVRFAPLFSDLHRLLEEVAGIDIANCKSRAVCQQVYFVAAGKDQEAFVHLELRLLEGRPPAVKERIGQACLEVMERVLAPSRARLRLQLTVEIVEMARDSYFKA